MTIQVQLSGVLTPEQQKMTYEQLVEVLQLELEEKLLQSWPKVLVVAKEMADAKTVVFSAMAIMEDEETQLNPLPGPA